MNRNDDTGVCKGDVGVAYILSLSLFQIQPQAIWPLMVFVL